MENENVPDRERVIAAITDALEETLGAPQENITEDTSLFNEIGLDSTGVFDVLMGVEASLGVEIDSEDLEMKDFSSIGTLADFLQKETEE
ncbi:acyl carrier protein [Curtobacterium sp. MCPF17_031]|uniref:acyl carrier protein n=1 Tax=Curtobacterium sp. MCPF17_031 TaxID=2175653 RepID=UPI000DAA61E6|nr:acyl carrier protein [Curtobacterium sp. MCPF17_031]PZE34232.1 acyl carrier protein [Curtobacterium sp. MCPF17_031]